MNYNKYLELQAKFAQALTNPLPGKRPVIRIIRPHYKRPPFNRTHKILRRRHRKKDTNYEHYNVSVQPYYAIRWVNVDSNPQPSDSQITSLEELADLAPKIVKVTPEEGLKIN